MYYGYKLKDPRTLLVKYVGITSHPKQRLNGHKSDKLSNSDKQSWIKDLSEAGLKPIMDIIFTSDIKEEAIAWEYHEIKSHLAAGDRLVNIRNTPNSPKPQKLSRSINDNAKAITTRQAMEILKVSKRTINRLIKEGKIVAIPSALDKRTKLVSRQEIEELKEREGR